MPKHIFRLVILFAVLLSGFLVARHFLIPESFGQYGHYRGLALDDNKNIDPKYSGKDLCGECHDDMMELVNSDLHKGISCEACHGPGWKHVQEPGTGQLIIPDSREFCGTCHSINPARPDFIKQVDLNEHNVDATCVECHNPHAPWN